ncbi:unnamed protein product [Thlaspi arvense]|uniref:Transposase MuDR plant domain-containing protein n=1 Tax=Thlaspi arvense TaxID=13288 RepID=A0AAU9RNV0_THLAR|nr:unnamed protein product [Thlaspi arvense]
MPNRDFESIVFFTNLYLLRMSTVSSFDLFLYVGGYWSGEGLYYGGEAEMVGKINSEAADDDHTVEQEDEEEQHDSSGESDLAAVVAQVDESKCKSFRLGQEYSTIEAFKRAITQYAARKRRDLSYHKSDSKRVVVICSDKKCPWRISASINSSSIRVVVRAFNNEHNCTWQGEAAYDDLKISIYCPWSRAKALLDEQIHKTKDCIPLIDKLRSCYANPLKAVGGMNMWERTGSHVNPPPYKKPPGRPPRKKRKREAGEARPGMISKKGTKIHCGLCGQEGHNRLYCKSLPVDKPPKQPKGRPRLHPVASASSSQMPVISASSSQAPDESTGLVAQSQPMEDLPSISDALTRRGRGRPRKSQFSGASSSQPNPTTRQEPIYDNGPVNIPREGVGLFTSLTGDD